MTSEEIVKELREIADSCEHWNVESGSWDKKACHEAADFIEQQQATIARLESYIEALKLGQKTLLDFGLEIAKGLKNAK